jgi:hypothetical protein
MSLMSRLALLALFGGISGVVQAQPSLQQGISNTTAAIQQVESVISQNQQALSKIFTTSGLDILQQAGGVSAIGTLKHVYSVRELINAINTGDYSTAIIEVAKAVADAWGHYDPRMKIGKAGVELAGEVYEVQSLLRQQAKLLEIHLNLEQQLFRLQGKTPRDLSPLEHLHAALDRDAAFQKSFLDALAKNGQTRADVTQVALMKASASRSTSFQIASGMISDPQRDVAQLAQVPGINPDFINALKRQFQLLQAGNVYAAMQVSKYSSSPSDYIYVFGPPRVNSGSGAAPDTNRLDWCQRAYDVCKTACDRLYPNGPERSDIQTPESCKVCCGKGLVTDDYYAGRACAADRFTPAFRAKVTVQEEGEFVYRHCH